MQSGHLWLLLFKKPYCPWCADFDFEWQVPISSFFCPRRLPTPPRGRTYLPKLFSALILPFRSYASCIFFSSQHPAATPPPPRPLTTPPPPRLSGRSGPSSTACAACVLEGGGLGVVLGRQPPDALASPPRPRTATPHCLRAGRRIRPPDGAAGAHGRGASQPRTCWRPGGNPWGCTG